MTEKNDEKEEELSPSDSDSKGRFCRILAIVFIFLLIACGVTILMILRKSAEEETREEETSSKTLIVNRVF